MTGAATEQSADASISAATSHWLGWAVFLGISWTWCIGMYLPALMVRDYGFWGWLVFAVPNVVGAAAMGWVLISPQSSIRMTEVHRTACKWFSGVTIAFHLYFCIYIIAPLASSLLPRQQSMELTVGAVLTAGTLMYLYMTHRRGSGRVLAWAVFFISLTLMLLVALEVRDIAKTQPAKMPPISWETNRRLIFFVPVFIFGFLACPYLDLTFHRARQQSGAPQAAFAVGFGGVFLLMIIFSLIYSRVFLAGSTAPLLAILIVVHMAIQTSFTIAAHARELQHDGEPTAIGIGILTVVAWVAYWQLPDNALVGKIHAGELIYRAFLGFYGLVFPAYVWLIMLPGRGVIRSDRHNLIVFWIAVIVALPMFCEAFIFQKLIWSVPALLLVLLARLGTNNVNSSNESFSQGFDPASIEPQEQLPG